MRKVFVGLFCLLFSNSILSQPNPSSPFALSSILVQGVVGRKRLATVGLWLKAICLGGPIQTNKKLSVKEWEKREMFAVIRIGNAAKQGGLLGVLPDIESDSWTISNVAEKLAVAAESRVSEYKDGKVPHKGAYIMTRVMFANRELQRALDAKALADSQRRTAHMQRLGVISQGLVDAIGKGSSVLFGEALNRFKSSQEALEFLGSREGEFQGYIDQTRERLQGSYDWRTDCGTVKASPKALKVLQEKGIEHIVRNYSEAETKKLLYDITEHSVVNCPPEPSTEGSRKEQALARHVQRMRAGNSRYYTGSPLRRGCLPSEIAEVKKKVVGLDGIETMWENLKSTKVLDPKEAAEAVLSF